MRALAFTIVLSGLALAGSGCRKADYEVAVPWRHDFLVARSDAAASNKPGIIAFVATYCESHNRVMVKALETPKVAAIVSRDFVAVTVDATNEDDDEVRRLAAKYHLIAIPSLVIVTPDFETVLYSQAGYEEPAKLQAAVMAAR